MKTIRISTLFLLSSLLSYNAFACKSCGCSASSKSHSHSEKSITKDVVISKSSVKWLAKKVTGSH